MKPNYGQALYDDFIHCAKALPVDADIFHVKDICDNDSIIKQFSNGVRKPLIDINTTGFEYVKNRIVNGYLTVDTDGKSTENSFDYFNSMPVELHPNIRLLRIFCVSVFRQNQEYHVINVHDWGLFPLATSFPGGWDGMRALCGVNAVPAFRES